MFIDLLHQRIRRRYERFGFRSRSLTLDQSSLHYYERPGTDRVRTLILVHGLGTSASTWIHVIPRLDPSWTILAPDLPGFGFSTLPEGKSYFDFDELLRALTIFLDRTARQPFVLLGHSLGGWLAAKYAAHHQQNVRRLILVDNAGILHDQTFELGQAFDLRTLGDVRRLLAKIWVRYPWYFKPFYPAILHDLRKRSVSEFVRSVREENFLNADLRLLRRKLNIVWGRGDRLVTAKSVQMMKTEIPSATVDYIERCGHVPQLENPREFLSVLSNILQQETEVNA